MSRTYKEFGDLLNAYNEADEKWTPIQKAHELLGSVNEDEIWEQRHAATNELFKYIAELESAQRWIPVSERLPEHGDFVLAWDNEIIEVLKYIRTFGGEWFIDIADAAVYPTHWMPLPEPPNDTQTDTFVYGKESEE